MDWFQDTLEKLLLITLNYSAHTVLYVGFFLWRSLSHVVPQAVGRDIDGYLKKAPRKAVRLLREINAI